MTESTQDTVNKLEYRIEVLEARVNQLFNFVCPLSQMGSGEFGSSDEVDVESKDGEEEEQERPSGNTARMAPVFLRFDQIPPHLLGRK